MDSKKAYSPAEFGALFGRSKSWTYGLYYQGKIVGIKDYGKLMIPASEAERITADAGKHPSKGGVGESGKTKNTAASAVQPSNAAITWEKWVKKMRQGKGRPRGVSERQITPTRRRKS